MTSGSGTALRLVGTASTRDQNTLEMLRKRVDFSASRAERTTFEQIWLKNVFYYFGKHNVFLRDGIVSTLSPEDIPEHKVFYKVNQVASSGVRSVAKVMGVSAVMRAIPQSTSIKHRNNAETSERLFEHVKQANNWKNKVQLTATFWAWLCGSGFYKTVWDQNSGKPTRFYKAKPFGNDVIPTPMLSHAERQQKDREGAYDDLPEGDVRITALSPFAVYHDWTSRDQGVEGCHWMADSHYVDKRIPADQFGIDEDDLSSDDQNAGLTRYEEAIAFASSYDWATPFAWTDTQDKRGKRCRFIDYYERPSREFKKGRRIVYAGGKLLLNGDNPYVGDISGASHLPYAKQDWAPAPGRFWGRGGAEDLTNPNYHLNETRSQMLQLGRIFASPRTYIYANSGLNKDEMTRDPGGIYVLNPMSKKPEVDSPAMIPKEVSEIGSICQSDIDMLSSQQTAEGGSGPGQMRTGAAIQSFNEARDIGLSIPAIAAVNAARDVGRAVLGIYKVYMPGERILRYMGNGSQWHVRNFQAADLTNDLIIIGEPSVSSTEASRKQDIYDAVETQVLSPQTNPIDRQIVFSALHYADADQAIQKALRAQHHQEDEIQHMIANWQVYLEEPFPVMPYDDHQSEADVLVTFFYTAEYDALQPEIKSVLTAHWQLHQDALQAMQMQQMQMAEAMKGTPGTKGQASKAK